MDTLKNIGMNPMIEQFIQENILPNTILGRVVKQFKDKYLVFSEENRIAEAEITGNLRYSAESSRDFPVVGDWVQLIPFGENYIIQQLIPRYSMLERKALAAQSETQLIAANLDYAFIVQGLNQDFNLNRLERYLVMVYAGNIKPIILLNKADLNTDEENQSTIIQVQERIGTQVPIYLLSAQSGAGISEWRASLQSGKSYCFLGSSGVGKSTLVNALIQQEVQLTAHISDATQKGRHTTTHREMFFMPGGAILIDNPGMRELGIVHDDHGLELTFAQITALAQSCKFSDCSHEDEPGCAIQKAISEGVLEEAVLENYTKIRRESEHFQKSVAQKRKEGKSFGKMYKQIIKHRKNRKY
ncbi:MAG: ribosome small subunit-dependent GTPase A [Microscillaceae bacterium]|nr:ribosome small subunit-dependent GTPase A [Microscillaceae bacterium]